MALNLDLAKLSRNASQISTGNAIINGGMDIWQRNVTFTSIAAASYTADRWKFNYSTSSATFDITRSTDVPTVAQAGRLFNYSLNVAVTATDASVAAGEFCHVYQQIEGQNFLAIAQKTFTISFWVKAYKTGTYCVSFINSGGDRSYIAEYTVNSSATWEYKTITVTASPSAGTWDYTTGNGLAVSFALATGSTYQTTANAWQAGNYRATSSQVNMMDSTSNYFRVTRVQVEPGTSATNFENRPIGHELMLCQRYFCKSYAYGSYAGAVTGTNYVLTHCPATTAQVYAAIPFPVIMRASPTVTSYNHSTGGSGTWRSSGATNETATPTNIGDTRFTMSINNTPSGIWMAGHYIADAEL